MPFDLAHLHEAHTRFIADHEAMIAEALGDGADIVQASIYQDPGFKPETGRSQAGTKTRLIRSKSGQILRVTNARANAVRLELGTQPHWIFPHKKKVLRFIGRGGKWVSTKVVKHPGTRPYLFVRRATEKANARVATELSAGMLRLSRRRY